MDGKVVTQMKVQNKAPTPVQVPVEAKENKLEGNRKRKITDTEEMPECTLKQRKYFKDTKTNKNQTHLQCYSRCAPKMKKCKVNHSRNLCDGAKKKLSCGRQRFYKNDLGDWVVDDTPFIAKNMTNSLDSVYESLILEEAMNLKDIPTQKKLDNAELIAKTMVKSQDSGDGAMKNFSCGRQRFYKNDLGDWVVAKNMVKSQDSD